MTDFANHLTQLEGHLARFKGAGILNRIAGRDVVGAGGVFQSISPVDKSVICDVTRSTEGDVDDAADAAAAAFPAWRDMPAKERKAVLLRIADGIEARAQEIALCECWDTGQAYKFMSKAALRGAENFRYFADQVTSARDGQHLKSPTLMNVTTRSTMPALTTLALSSEPPSISIEFIFLLANSLRRYLISNLLFNSLPFITSTFLSVKVFRRREEIFDPVT